MVFRDLPKNKTYEDEIDNKEIKVAHYPINKIKYEELSMYLEYVNLNYFIILEYIIR